MLGFAKKDWEHRCSTSETLLDVYYNWKQIKLIDSEGVVIIKPSSHFQRFFAGPQFAELILGLLSQVHLKTGSTTSNQKVTSVLI